MEENSPFQQFDNHEFSPRQRHGCVTAWLIFMIVVNTLSSLAYFFNGEAIRTALQINISPLMMLLLGFLGVGNIIFAVMLLQWKKIGFYGFIVTSFVSFGINLAMGANIIQAIFGLIGIGVLYGILQFRKGDKTAWDNLE